MRYPFSTGLYSDVHRYIPDNTIGTLSDDVSDLILLGDVEGDLPRPLHLCYGLEL